MCSGALSCVYVYCGLWSGIAASTTQDDLESLVQISADVRSVSHQNRHGYYRQQLKNIDDVQYTGEILVGEQKLDGILDTGSFEVMIFPTSCTSCGNAGAEGFNMTASETLNLGVLSEVHAFGSGTLETVSAIDRFQVGPHEVPSQALWIVTSADMEVLEYAAFQAIVGMGPPGQPQKEAGGQLAKALQELQNIGLAKTAAEVDRVRELQNDVSAARIKMQRNDSVLANLNVTLFSVCFEWKSNAPGYWIWNDVFPQRQPDIFTSITVASDSSWSVRMQDAAFEGEEGIIQLGCETGCGAIVDSGTSLIAVPTNVYNLALTALNKLDSECSNMHTMPDLVFQLDGHKYSLPPQSYVGIVYGNTPPRTENWFPRRAQTVRACELLLMDTGTLATNLGPLWIIGMPFFRYYYTVFDLRSDPRKIWTAAPDDDCSPQGSVMHANTLKRARQQGPNRVNASHIRAPTRKYSSSASAST